MYAYLNKVINVFYHRTMQRQRWRQSSSDPRRRRSGCWRMLGHLRVACPPLRGGPSWRLVATV